tara:strand:+ start:74 stop:784 length:711 start_codon:yes stop_codon:yes gene_type:complete
MSQRKEIIINEKDDIVSFIGYYPNVIPNRDLTWDWLDSQNDYRGGEVSFLKKSQVITKDVPRRQKWHHENMEYFTTEWNSPQYYRWQSCKYNNQLKDIQDKAYALTTNYLKGIFSGIPKFNSCLINVYENGNNSINLHADSNIAFGEYPIVSVLSFGDSRTINFKRRLYDEKNPRSIILDKDNQELNYSFELNDNSCLIMAGSTQKYYAHEIPKECNKKKRYSLSFRKHILNTKKY